MSSGSAVERALAAVRRRHALACGGDAAERSRERGTTLMELVVGMMIMTIFMGIFTSAVVMLWRSANKSQAVNLSSAQLNQAFLSLDETVRYAAAISTPAVGSSTGDWYVELRTTSSGSEVCTQLRVDITGTQLQRRTWTVTNAVAGTPSAWVPVASGITNGAAASGSATQPFVLQAESAAVNFQRLRVNLVAASGTGTAATSTTSSYQFTAINSTVPAPSGVCTFTGWRP